MANPWSLAVASLTVQEPTVDDLDEQMPRGAAEGEIPAIDEPSFSAGRWLKSEDEVLVVEGDEHTRAYPIRVLDYHEIVNDEIDGRPVAVTFCPLAGTGIAWERQVEGRELSFIVSGRLFRNDLVMTDRETGSLWPQILGRALHGELAGTQLDPVACWRTTWDQFRSVYPDGLALDRPGIHPATVYENRSHPGYADEPGTLFEPEHEDARLAPKDRVFGLARGDDALAVRVEDLEEVGLTVEEVDGEDAILGVARGRRFAWWTGGRDFSVEDGHLVGPDGKRWDPFTGENGGEPLELAAGVTAFWFAWADFFPETQLWHEER